jgi:hypothetical protein
MAQDPLVRREPVSASCNRRPGEGLEKQEYSLCLCVFSHQSADYSGVVAHMMSNSFEGHPCCMHADYLPSLCF